MPGPQDERLMDQEDDGAQAAPAAAKPRPYIHPRARAARQDERVAQQRRADDRDFSEDRELTDDIRLEAFRNSRAQSILPDLPVFPGFHVCWLTTTNSRDPISTRLRQGYELIRLEDCPGWEGLTGVKDGRYSGVVGIEEMVAAKLPIRLYNEYLAINHSEAPREEEEKLLRSADGIAEQAERMGGNIIPGDGLETLRSRAPRPRPMTE